jgi:hypothetical protein
MMMPSVGGMVTGKGTIKTLLLNGTQFINNWCDYQKAVNCRGTNIDRTDSVTLEIFVCRDVFVAGKRRKN